MNFQEFLKFDHAELITPIGLSFGLQSTRVDFFVLEVIGDRDSPIRSDGRMIAFASESLCRDALELLKPTLPTGVTVEQKYEFICDIAAAIRIVKEDECDHNAVVLNCVNTLLDFVATGPFEIPEEYRILLSLADRLTFRAELGEFIQTRSLIQNALLWCAGITTVDLKLVESVSQFETLMPILSAEVHK